jgi:facilitated trehalose transporter
MAFSAILIPQLSLPDSDIKIDLNSASTVASIVTLSIAFGALLAGPLMDKYGRKRLAMSICGPFIIAWLMVLFASNIYMIYVARLISGVAGGTLFDYIFSFKQ